MNVHHTSASRATSPVQGQPPRQIALRDLDEDEHEDDDDEERPERLLHEADGVEDAATRPALGSSSVVSSRPSEGSPPAGRPGPRRGGEGAASSRSRARRGPGSSSRSLADAVSGGHGKRHWRAGGFRRRARGVGARDASDRGHGWSGYSATERMASRTGTCSSVKFSRRYGLRLGRGTPRRRRPRRSR